MKKINYKGIFYTLGLSLFLSLFFSSCSKDDYYTDGGLAKAEFDGSILAYFDAHPRQFDTLAAVIRAANMEQIFNEEEFTFFAPSDQDIKDLIGTVDKGGLNRDLYFAKLDTITTFTDVDPLIWQRYLMRHMFKGKNLLKDYPQIDYDLRNIYGGQYYRSFAGNVSNIGVVYNDASGNGSTLKYMGYRQLHISYVYDETLPDIFRKIPISTSDIQPKNGVIHVIDYTISEFGFNHQDVKNDIIISKR